MLLFLAMIIVDNHVSFTVSCLGYIKMEERSDNRFSQADYDVHVHVTYQR